MLLISGKQKLEVGYLRTYYAQELEKLMERENITKYDIHKKTGLHYDTIASILECGGYSLRSLENLLLGKNLIDVEL